MEKVVDKSIKIIVSLYLIVLPWLVMPYRAYYNEDEKLLFPSGVEGVYDIFLYGKMLLTIIAAVIVFILLIISVLKYGYKLFDFSIMTDKIICICIIIYLVCTIMSYVCSPYKQLALSGGVNSFEGTPVFIAYVILFFGGRYIIEKTKINILEYIAMFNACILLLCTIIEVNYKTIAEIVVGQAVESEYPGMLCLTFYNPAYCAGFVIILFSVCLYYFYKADILIKNVIWCLLSATTFISGLLTRSTAAFYIIMLEMLAYICIIIISYIMNRKIKCEEAWERLCVDKKNIDKCTKGKKTYINKNIAGNNAICNILKLAGMLFVIIAICLVDLVIGIDREHILENARKASVNETTSIHEENYYKVNDIELHGNVVQISGDYNKFICGIDKEGRIYFTDENDNIINAVSQNGIITFSEPYSMIQASIQNNALCINLGYKGKLRFLMYNDNFYPVLSDGSVVKDISSQSNIKTTGSDSMFTGRGYIWRNTLPLLKHTIVFGHGAGTFEMYFKQFDYVGLLNSQGNVDLLIDKPHSMYLQIACNQGVICLFAVVIIVITIVLRNIFGFIVKNKYDENVIKTNYYKDSHTEFIFSIILIVSFMIFELITDSNISVNPIFVVIAGMSGARYKYGR